LKKKSIYVLFLFLVLIWPTSNKGQTPGPAIGIKQGLTFSTLAVDNIRSDLFDVDIDQVSKKGYTGGIMFRHFLQPHLGLQIELNFVQKGWSEEIDKDIFLRTTLNYIELPFLTNIYLGKRKTKYFFNLGPNLGYLISSSEGSFNPALEENIKYRISQDEPNKVSVGLITGFGINRSTPFGQFQFDFYFNLGFSNIFEMTRDDLPENSATQVLGLSMAYLWDLSK